MEIAVYGIAAVAIIAIVIMVGCSILAWFTDYEAAGNAGCIEEGQIW